MNSVLVKLQKLLFKVLYWNKPVVIARKQGVKVGNSCRFMKGIDWGSEPYLIEVGDHVLISKDTYFVTHDGCANTVRGITKNDDIQKFGRIRVKDNASIGTRCIILPGVTIGENSIVGAGSVVSRDIPDGQVWAGAPA